MGRVFSLVLPFRRSFTSPLNLPRAARPLFVPVGDRIGSGDSREIWERRERPAKRRNEGGDATHLTSLHRPATRVTPTSARSSPPAASRRLSRRQPLPHNVEVPSESWSSGKGMRDVVGLDGSGGTGAANIARRS